MRSDNRKRIVDQNNKSTPLKTAVIVNEDDVTLEPAATLTPTKKRFNSKIASIESDRAVEIDEFSENGTPVKGHTLPPKKSPLYLHKSLEALTILSNIPPSPKKKRRTSVNKDFYKSGEYKKSPKIPEDATEKEISFKIYKRSRQHTGSRNQNKIMGCSATDYCSAMELDSPPSKKIKKKKRKRGPAKDNPQWNHLGANQFSGPKRSMKPENLAAMSSAANTPW